MLSPGLGTNCDSSVDPKAVPMLANSTEAGLAIFKV